jgi:hypothetical protein
MLFKGADGTRSAGLGNFGGSKVPTVVSCRGAAGAGFSGALADVSDDGAGGMPTFTGRLPPQPAIKRALAKMTAGKNGQVFEKDVEGCRVRITRPHYAVLASISQ